MRPQLADTLFASNERIERAFSPASVSQPSTAELPDLITCMAEAAEELTFQFSEKVEAFESALEDRLKTQQAVSEEEINKTLRIKDIHAVIKVLEGRVAFDSIRRQARAFAQAFAQDPDRAMALLNLDSMEPTHRYALMQMALSALGPAEKSHEARQEFEKYLQQDDPQVSSIKALIARKSDLAETRSQQDTDTLSILDTKPTVRGIFDAAAVVKNTQNMSESVDQFQSTWIRSNDLNDLEQIGGFIIINRIVEVVRTMLKHVKDLNSSLGVIDISSRDTEIKNTRMLLDVGSTSVPSSAIDKFVNAMLALPRGCPRCSKQSLLKCVTCDKSGKACLCPSKAKPCSCKDIKQYLLSLLYRQIQGWPPSVWVSIESKPSVLEQLIKKQQTTRMLPWANSVNKGC